MISMKMSCFQFPSIDIDEELKQRIVITACAGFLFFSGWWIFIDVILVHKDIIDQNMIYITPGICETAAMFIINLTPYKLSRDYFTYGDNKCPPITSLGILFSAFVISFGAVFWSIYILVETISINNPTWFGLGILLQNIFILVSSLLLKFLKELQDNY